jgi:putative transcriptional regulator
MARKDERDVEKRYLSGKLLIAMPSIGDPRFDHSVVLMCDHSDQHAMGIVINKPVEGLRLPALFDQLGVDSADAPPDRPVRLGGPVDRERGFVIHSGDFDAEGSTLAIAGGIGLTATKDVLEAIASSSPPRRSLLALGYSGWGPGQLEDELAGNAWLVAEADETLIFEDEDTEKWERALSKIGVSPEHLSAVIGNA